MTSEGPPEPKPIRRLRIVGYLCPLCDERMLRMNSSTSYKPNEDGTTAYPLSAATTVTRFHPCGCEHTYQHHAPAQ